ncbi:unnamed protein product, partial [Phaeothamnion confervicola]
DSSEESPLEGYGVEDGASGGGSSSDAGTDDCSRGSGGNSGVDGDEGDVPAGGAAITTPALAMRRTHRRCSVGSAPPAIGPRPLPFKVDPHEAARRDSIQAWMILRRRYVPWRQLVQMTAWVMVPLVVGLLLYLAALMRRPWPNSFLLIDPTDGFCLAGTTFKQCSSDAAWAASAV